MKIAVLNGSPKGQTSVTMQYVKFLQLKFPDVEFQFFDVAQKIKKLEADQKEFEKISGEISSADAVLWAFPLYFFLVSSQYKRFIELIFERNALASFRNKPAAVLTTSINFFDHTAHNYMNAICDDLQMNFIDFYSAEMNNLLKLKERRRLKTFGELFIQAIKEKTKTIKNNRPLIAPDTVYEPSRLNPVGTEGKKVLIVADDLSKSANLRKMVETLRQAFEPQAQLVELKDIDIKGGCLGCVQCGLDNICVYEGKDGFIDFFKTQIKSADILFYAGAIADRFLSSLWKCFFDRSFFHGHIPMLEGKQIGFVVAGPLGQIANLRQMMEAYAGMQHANLLGIVSDDCGGQAEINTGLQWLAERSVICSRFGYIKPPTFLQVGGTKLFRDVIWSRLRPVFQADHRYYKQHGYYDFPQKNYKWRVINNLLVLLTKIPVVRREFVKRIKDEMIRPFTNALSRMK
jgi:multimeric flavodoxin WrbA